MTTLEAPAIVPVRVGELWVWRGRVAGLVLWEVELTRQRRIGNEGKRQDRCQHF